MVTLSPCPVCGAVAETVGTSLYRTSLNTWHPTIIVECHSCDIFIRVLQDSDRSGHFYAASYVQPERDGTVWNERRQFLCSILELANHHLPKSFLRLLDVGCSYGHLLELARTKGIDAEGIEINKNLLALCEYKGLTVWPSLDSITRPADVITLIDSLYYLPRPVESVCQLRTKLSSDGIMVIRVTNRNWFIRARATIVGKYDFEFLGDAEVGYSVRGISRLLEYAGFTVTAILPDSLTGRKLALKTRAIGVLTLVATNLTFRQRFLTPGVIVIARPTGRSVSSSISRVQ